VFFLLVALAAGVWAAWHFVVRKKLILHANSTQVAPSVRRTSRG